MNGGIFKLGQNDLVKGLFTAVFGAVLTSVLVVLGGIINTQGFDLWLVDWGTVWHMVANVSVVSGFGAFTGYIFKNFVSDKNGAVFGVAGGEK